MRLLNPTWLFAAALLGPLVLWYVLRSRRPPRLLPSTMLLADEQQTASAAIPWQPFLADRTFWLVALATLLATAGLARPAIAVPADVADHTILVVDASASMAAATEAGGTRLEAARAAAHELLDLAGDARVVSVVHAGTRATVLADAVPPREARRAIDRLTVGATRPAVDEALTLAAALVRPDEETVVHLITDGGLPDGSLVAAPAALVVTIVGDSRPNLTVSAVHASPLGGAAARVLVEVASAADLPATGRVLIRDDEGVLAEQPVQVAPRSRTDVEVEVEDVTGDVLEVVLTASVPTPDGRVQADALPGDDRAWVVLPERRGVQVLHVGPDDVFLDAALAALPDVTVVRLPALPDAGPDGEPAVLPDADVLIVDRVAVPATLPLPTLAIAPASLPDGATTTGRVERPAVTSVAADHPLLLDAPLDGLAVAEMAVVDAPSLQAVVDGPDGPLVLVGRLGGAAAVVLPFALADSTLPLQAAMPVLVANALQLLAGPSADAPLVAGADRALPLTDDGPATLVDPDGAVIAVSGTNPTATLDRSGVWTLRRDGDPDVHLAVNPDAEEGDLTVPARVDLPARAAVEGDGGDRVVVGQTALGDADPPPPPPAGLIELGRWLLLAAAAVLACELLLSHGSSRRRGGTS